MTATRLMILGWVKMVQPVHGYEIRRELLSWQVDEWAGIAPGSIYHALRKLTTEGLLEEVATEQVGARPARTTYRLTPRGDEEFEDLLRTFWWQHKQAVDPFQAAFSFIAALPQTEAGAALRNRARLLRAAADGLAAAGRSDWLRESKPPQVSWMFELSEAKYRIEADWCERIADRVEAGEAAWPRPSNEK